MGFAGRFLAVAMGAGVVQGVVAQDALVVRIGHVAPVSGAQAHYGKDNENGARMAVDELNARGMTIGGRRARFELVAEDDAADPKQGTAAALKLCDAKVNGVVGHLNSGTTIPAGRVYSDCGLPQITPSATNPKFTQLGYRNAYRLLANDNALGAGLAMHAARTLGAKTVAVVDDRTAYGQGVADVFRRVAKSLGLQVVADEYTTDKATDFTAILTTIKARRPDVVFFGGMDPQAGPLLRQMEQLGMDKVPLLGGDGFCTTRLPELAAQARTLASAVCAVGGVDIDRMPGGVAWKQRYDKRYPGQFQVYSPYAYDAVMVLADAMQRAGSADPKVYAPLLRQTNLHGVTAQIQFDADGELKQPAMTLFHYVDGKRVALAK